MLTFIFINEILDKTATETGGIYGPTLVVGLTIVLLSEKDRLFSCSLGLKMFQILINDA